MAELQIYKKCRDLLLAGRSNDADRHFENNSAPNITALFSIAILFFQCNELRIALKYFVRTMNADLNNFYAYYSKTHPGINLSISDGIACHIRSPLDTSYSELFHYLALTLSKLGEYEEALKCYDWTILLSHDSCFDALFHKANTLFAMSRFEDAVTHFDLVLERHQDHFHANFYKSHALNKLNKCEDAIAACIRALEIEPENQDALKFLEDLKHS